MKQKTRSIFIGILLVISLLLAPYAQVIIQTLIIEPIAYYWWGVRRMIEVIPQAAFWFFIIGSLGMIVIFNLLRSLALTSKPKGNTLPQAGPIQSLAEAISQSQKSNYFKWMIANRLANLTFILLNRHNGDNNGGSRNFSQENWNPPMKTEEYLVAGMNSSFMDYPRKGRFSKKLEKTPFDTDLEQVIAYIESQMEL
jgi:hypothetical protein